MDHQEKIGHELPMGQGIGNSVAGEQGADRRIAAQRRLPGDNRSISHTRPGDAIDKTQPTLHGGGFKYRSGILVLLETLFAHHLGVVGLHRVRVSIWRAELRKKHEP